MRGLFSLPVLDGVSGEVIGHIPPSLGMMTNFGSILQYDRNTCMFLDDKGVVSSHVSAQPWVEEAEAARWGFSHEAPMTALAV